MSAASDSADGHLFGLLIFREPSEEGLGSLHNLVCYPFTPSSVRSFPVSVSKFSPRLSLSTTGPSVKTAAKRPPAQ